MIRAFQSLPLKERRKELRRRTLKSAKIVFNERSSVIDCTVRNHSRYGALLQVATVVGIPECFNVQIDGVMHPAKTIWRIANEIGVTFPNET